MSKKETVKKDELETAMENDQIIAPEKEAPKEEEIDKSKPIIEITVSLSENQMVETVIKTRKDKKQVTMQEAVGMLEMGKHDLMGMNDSQPAPQGGQQLEMVDIVIDEIDFALDVEGGLDARGVKIGDTVKFPKMAMARRDQMRKDHIEAQKKKK